jgi:hypothetical protein
MLAHFIVAMPATPVSLPSADAPDAAFRTLRELALVGDRAARRAVGGPHPAVWRMPQESRAALEVQITRGADEQGELGARGDALKLGNSSTVQRVYLADGRPAILKHYLPTRRFDPRDRYGHSKAIRSLLAAEALQRRGFHVATALAAWSRAGRGSWLLLEDLGELHPLHEAVVEVEGAARAALLTTVATVVRQLHRAGVAYRDLKPSNLLVRLPGTAAVDLRLLDHDRNRFRRQEIPRELALRDLAALHAGLPPQVRASERLAALRAYDPSLLQPRSWRRYLPALLEEAAARRHRWIARHLLAGVEQA